MFYLQLAEYILLRMIRRYLFSYNVLLRIGKFIPGFGVNGNQESASATVDAYIRLISEFAPEHLQKAPHIRVLDIGCGVTNTVGLILAERLGCEVHVCDPYVQFDQAGTNAGISRFGISEQAQMRTLRVDAPDASGYDLILSCAVLEHVKYPDQFFVSMKNVLRPAGTMVHIVDYRDHFFKYPYFFLMFSDAVWNNLLSPGDLFRWRLDDHLAACERAGMHVRVGRQSSLSSEFAKVANRLQTRFRAMPFVDVTSADIIVTEAK